MSRPTLQTTDRTSLIDARNHATIRRGKRFAHDGWGYLAILLVVSAIKLHRKEHPPLSTLRASGCFAGARLSLRLGNYMVEGVGADQCLRQSSQPQEKTVGILRQHVDGGVAVGEEGVVDGDPSWPDEGDCQGCGSEEQDEFVSIVRDEYPVGQVDEYQGAGHGEGQ